MWRRLLLLVLLPLLAAAGGFGAGRWLAGGQAAQAAAQDGPGKVVTLGKFAFQVYHPAAIRVFVTELQVTLRPGAAAAGLADGPGRARLVDRCYQLLFAAAETPAFQRGDVPAPQIAALLGAGLGRSFPGGLASVEVLSAVSSDQPRN
jgi:hypothetical protein